MIRNIKLTLEYDGTNFHGWQVQSKNERTVQGEIEQALKIIFHKKIKLIGSGRTDSGVHASGQVANFPIESDMDCEEILKALNGNLPEDITILNTEQVKKNFHAQYSAKSKTYRYTILNRSTRSSQDRHFCLYYPYSLNVPLIKMEACLLIGKHDFRSFQAADPAKRDLKEKDNTVRTIKKINVLKQGDYIYIDITADGFLYKMVRNIVGTLLQIGSGKLPTGSIKKILNKKDRNFAGYTAKAKGLNLLKVIY